MITYAITSGKGGTGKTTLTFNLGYLLAEKFRVLMIDSDPQMSLSLACQIDNPSLSLAQVIESNTPERIIDDAIYTLTETLHILPSSLKLSGIEGTLGQRTGADFVLKRALTGIANQYDFCLIDAPPHLAKLSINILVAANKVIIPIIPDTLSIHALGALLKSIEEVQQPMLNPSLKVEGIVINQYSDQSNHHKNAVNAIKETELPILATIGKTVKLAEAMGNSMPLHKQEPNNPRVAELQTLLKNLCQ